MILNRFFKTSYLTAIYCFLYIPILILTIYSFNQSTFSTEWHGMTWDWYIQLFHDSELLTITAHSFIVAILAASLAVAIAALGSMALFIYQFLGRQLLYHLVYTLIIVPDLVFGISLLVLYMVANMALGFWTVLLAHITFCLPFVLVIILSQLEGIDRNIFEAARNLGATDFVIFSKIILPLTLPSLIAGWLLSFTLSLDDVIISFFVTGPSFQVLPVYIYSHVRIGVTPEINALCALMFGLTALLVLISQICIRRPLSRV